MKSRAIYDVSIYGSCALALVGIFFVDSDRKWTYVAVQLAWLAGLVLGGWVIVRRETPS